MFTIRFSIETNIEVHLSGPGRYVKISTWMKLIWQPNTMLLQYFVPRYEKEEEEEEESNGDNDYYYLKSKIQL